MVLMRTCDTQGSSGYIQPFFCGILIFITHREAVEVLRLIALDMNDRCHYAGALDTFERKLIVTGFVRFGARGVPSLRLCVVSCF